jgi:hypothetical protein
MSISRCHGSRWDWHPNVFHVLGIGILVMLSVGAIQVVESAGGATEVTFDEALAEYRHEAVTPTPEPVAEPAPATGQDLAPLPPPEPDAQDGASAPDPPTTADRPRAEPEPDQAEPPAPAPPAAFIVPAAGVYRYRATGGEWLNMPGANRTYPEESYATVRPRGGCRWTFEHRVAQEHVDRREYCSNPGELLFLSGETRVTFYGQTDGSTISCDPPAVMVREGEEPGATHTSTCTGDDGTETTERTTYLGREAITIGGVEVAAHKITFTAQISGRATGTSESTVWLYPGTGLMLRVERQTDSTTDAFGGRVRYQEAATFQLLDLEPRT